MALIEKDGFEFIADLAGETSLILNDEQFNSQIKYIKFHNLKKLCLRGTRLSSIKNLSFLQEIDFITDISISELKIEFSGLYYLKNLQKLITDIENKNQYLDFSKFPHLKHLSISGKNIPIDLLLNHELEEFILYKHNSKCLRDLNLPINLRRLKLNSSNIVNFEGIEHLNLDTIETYYCSNLISLKGLNSQSSTLHTLHIENSKKLSDYTEIENCLNLEKIFFYSCGEIPTIKWLNKMNKISFFNFHGTVVLDNDLSPCIGKKVFFKNFKSYNYTLKQING